MLLLLFSACLAYAQIAKVSVLGVTNVQALLSYQSSVDDSCSIEVSERSDYKPLVHDVDPALFPGADSDSRPGSYSDGRDRVFAIGKRGVEQGTDGKWYSRALQTNTVHYYRLRCGSDTVTGAFRTANLPVGVTYPWPIPQDPKTGDFRWPTIDNEDRSQTIVDPNYGTLIRRVSLEGDAPDPDIQGLRKPFTSAAGNNWANPPAGLADDSDAATYSGAGQDWLVLTNPNFGLTPFYTQNDSVGPIVVRIKGSGQGGSPDDRTVDVCLTLDGAACKSQILTAALDTGESVRTLAGWSREGIYPDDVNGKSFGVMIRAHAPGGPPVSIQYAEIELSLNVMPDMPNGGFGRLCAPVKSNGGFHCAWPTSLGKAVYWIQPDTGEVRWLGKMLATGWGGDNAQCKTDFAMWDFNDPNIYYCGAQLNGKSVLLKGTYTGNDAASQPGGTAAFQWVNLTPEGSTVTELLQKFRPGYDPKQFGCDLSFVVNQYAVFECLMSSQNSAGWLAAFDLGNKQPLDAGGTGRLVAAAQSYAAPNTRWCGIHSTEYVGDINWIGWSANSLDGVRYGAGQGPYTVTLQSPLPSQVGRVTIQVSGEPEAPSGQSALTTAQEGDVFQVQGGSGGWDFLRILRKNSATSWLVDRTVTETTPLPWGPGTKLMAYCNAFNLDTPREGPYAYWSFLEDPKAQDTTKTTWVPETVLVGGHIVERGDYRIMAHWQGYQVVTPGIPKSWNHQASFKVISNPRWASGRAYVGLPATEDGLANTYQQHLSYENYRAAGPGRNNWFIDFLPFIGEHSMTPQIAPVSGSSQVFRASVAGLDGDKFPTFAVCGGRQLKDVSPGPIGDQDTYAYCVGTLCQSGAAASDVFVNCPAPVSPKSSCEYTLEGKDDNVCVGNLAPYGQSVTQFFLDPSGLRNRVLTNALMPWHSSRTRLSLETTYALPDGSWAIFPGFGNNARRDLFLVKIPPEPPFDPDPNKGSQMVSATVTVAPPDSTTRQLVLKYGGTAAVGSATNPVDCFSGTSCTVSVDIRPLEFLFSQPTFRDGAGQNVGSGKVRPQLGGATPGSGLGKPVFRSSAVVNSASFEPKLAPGSLVSIFGDDLANCAGQAPEIPLPSTLCGASVTVNGKPGFLHSTSLNQVDFVLPGSLPAQQDASALVTRDGIDSDPVQIPGAEVLEVAPAIYAYTLGDQNRRAVIVQPDTTTNGPSRPDLGMRPLKAGESALLYANGLGPTNPPVADGQAAPSDPPSAAASQVSVFINGVSQPVSFAGLAPSYTAVYQVNFTVDPSTPVRGDGKDQIWIAIKGTESPRLLVSLAAP